MTDQNLRTAQYLSLETFRRDGRGVPTPVWFAPDGDTWWVFSAADVGKVKRLRHTARVRIAPCDVRGRLLGPAVETRAGLVDDPARCARGHACLVARYGWQMRLLDLGARLAGRYHRRQFIAIAAPVAGGPVA